MARHHTLIAKAILVPIPFTVIAGWIAARPIDSFDGMCFITVATAVAGLLFGVYQCQILRYLPLRSDANFRDASTLIVVTSLTWASIVGYWLWYGIGCNASV